MNITDSPQPIRLWPNFAPGESSATTGCVGDVSGNVLRITDVTSPQLFVYGAQVANAKGAVIVLPGGGYEILAADLEGSEIALWLASLGLVAAILHYRCPDNRDGAYQDGRRAISWLRAHASQLGVDPHKVGVLGFSAGGHLSARLAANGSERPYQAIDEIDTFACAPDFAMPIYPAWLIDRATNQPTADVAPSAAMPPLFLAQSRDDAHFCSEAYADFARGAGVDVTSKVYESGGHGYGIRLPESVSVSRWKSDAKDWLERFI